MRGTGKKKKNVLSEPETSMKEKSCDIGLLGKGRSSKYKTSKHIIYQSFDILLDHQSVHITS